MLKKTLIGMATILPMTFFTAGYAFAAENNNYTIELNGTELNAPAYSELGELNFPLRPVSEALGYAIGWTAKDHEVSLTKAEDKIQLDFNEYTITDGDHQFYMGGEFIKNNTTYVGEEFLNDSLGLKVSVDKANKIVKLDCVKENDIEIKSITESSAEPNIDIKVHYPQISGLTNKTVEDKINTLLKQEAISAKNEGLDYIKQYPEDITPNKNEVYYDYRIKYNQNNLLSVVLLNYQYRGGAHGDTVETAHTFDLNTGKDYGMRDLFKADASYVAIFNDVVKSDIAERELYLLTPFESITTGQAFYLENNGVSIYFEPYEYFPHAAGIQVFTEDYSELKELLDLSLGLVNQSANALDSTGRNVINVGNNGTVTLKGNPTTGFEWKYAIADNSVIKLDSESSIVDSNAIGAGSTFTWNFKAMKAGETKITFKYYRSWEGEASAEQTIEYLIKVN